MALYHCHACRKLTTMYAWLQIRRWRLFKAECVDCMTGEFEHAPSAVRAHEAPLRTLWCLLTGRWTWT